MHSMIADDDPVSPLCLPCNIDYLDGCLGREVACNMLCCGGLGHDEDIAEDDAAVLDDVVVGLEVEDGKIVHSLRELPAPKGMAAAERRLHRISHVPYDDRCPFLQHGKEASQPSSKMQSSQKGAAACPRLLFPTRLQHNNPPDRLGRLREAMAALLCIAHSCQGLRHASDRTIG